jgi:hypothetical protein
MRKKGVKSNVTFPGFAWLIRRVFGFDDRIYWTCIQLITTVHKSLWHTVTFFRPDTPWELFRLGTEPLHYSLVLSQFWSELQSQSSETRVEAGSNTSTVILRVVGGDEKGNLKSDSKIWSRVSRDSDPKKTALARASSMYKWQIRLLVKEGAPQRTRP